MNIVGPDLNHAAECEAIMRSLPMWFGIEQALLLYARDTTTMPTFGLMEDSRLLGFLTLREHFPQAWEIHCVAIAADARGQGRGSHLLAHAESWLASRGVALLQVKTVAANSASAEYAETRKFYERRGFVPLEIFPELWDPWNPALQCIKVLRPPAIHSVPSTPHTGRSWLSFAWKPCAKVWSGWADSSRRARGCGSWRAFRPNTQAIVIDGKRVGFFVVTPEPRSLLLAHLYLRPSHQGLGAGSAVLRSVFERADAEGVDIRVGALKGSDANRFYLRHGFELVEEAEFDNYYIRRFE